MIPELSNYILLLADIISLFPLVICLSLLYNFLVRPGENILDLILFIVIIVSDFFVKYLKRLDYPTEWYEITRRPDGASNCDYLSRKGKCKPGTPGMPSGHMTSISIFAVFMILLRINYGDTMGFNITSLMFLLVNLGLIVLTAFARYYKKCHNGYQIIAGTILGSIIGSITFGVLHFSNLGVGMNKIKVLDTD